MPGQFERLNQEFYEGEPATYFRDRLRLLSLRAVKSTELLEAQGDVLSWGEIQIVTGTSDGSTEEAAREEAALNRFVLTESQVLLHHASEALLRLFFAHAGSPECPWLSVSAMNHREFNRETRKLAKRTWPEGFEDAAGDVFLGGVPPEPSEKWIEARGTAVRLMRVLAGRLTDDKHLYNSAKHGLSCLAVNQSIAFYKDFKDGKPVGEPIIGADGAAMVFLEKEEKSKGEWTWYHKSQWLNAQQAALLTHLAVVQMEALWTVARARYLGKPLEPFEVVDNDAIEHALKGFSTDRGILTWRRAVATERTATSSPDTSIDPPPPEGGKRPTLGGER